MSPESSRLATGIELPLKGAETHQTTALEEFALSAAYSGLQAPVDAVGQLVGWKPPKVFEPPREAEFASADWYAQQFGAGLGALPLFLGVNKGIGKLTGPLASPVTRAALSGLVYEGLFRPTDANATFAQLARERGTNAVSGAITFASMAQISDMCRRGIPVKTKGPGSWSTSQFAKELGFNAGVGLASGTAGGLVNAELHTLAQGQVFDSPDHYLRSAYSFAVIGAGLDMLGTHKRRAPEPAKMESGVATTDGRYYAKRGSVVHRTDGCMEAYTRGQTVELFEGDGVFTPAELVVKRKGLQFKHNDLVWGTDRLGRIISIQDNANRSTTSVKYTAISETGASKIRSISTTKNRGQVQDNNLWLNYDYKTETYNQQKPLGTEAKIQLDGTVKITGANPEAKTAIGKALWDNRAVNFESILLKRNGVQVWEFGKEGEVTKQQDGRILQVKEGLDCTDYGYDSKGNLVKASFAGGRQLQLKDGYWHDGDKGGLGPELTVSEFGTLELKPHPKLRLGRYPNQELTKVTFYPAANQVEYQFPVDVKAPLDSRPIPVRATPREVLQSRLTAGELKQDGQGLCIDQKPTGEILKFDADGRIASVRNRHGQDIVISRDSSGVIDRINFSRDGVLERSLVRANSSGWNVLDGQGRFQMKRRAAGIELDGSVTELNQNKDDATLDWTGIKERPDGLRVHIDKVLRERISAGDLGKERTRVESLVRTVSADSLRTDRFLRWMQTFETRGARRAPPISADEVANTYYQLDRLLSTDQALFGRQDRLALAEQFMFKAAYPHTITQGGFGTCNVTAETQNRFINKFPSAAIRVVTDIATTGRMFTSDGTIIDLRQMKNVLVPFKAKTPTFDPTTFDSQRDFFDQIFQSAAVNTYWQRVCPKSGIAASTLTDLRNGKPYQPGDLRYELTEKETKPEVLCDYGKDPPSRRIGSASHSEVDIFTNVKRTVVTNIPADSPELGINLFREIEKQLLGFNDKPHIVSAKSSVEVGAVLVDSATELANTLVKMKADGAFPATVRVDGRSALMGGRTGNEHSAHVLNVQDIYQVNNGWRVEITNQWGSKWNHLGPEKALPVAKLWEAMKNARDNKPIDEPEPVRTPTEWIWLSAAEAAIIFGLHAGQYVINEEKRHAKPK